MPAIDYLNEIQPLHTITSTETTANWNGLTLPASPAGSATPGPIKGYQVRIQYLNALQASGSGVWTFTVQASYNRGSSWAAVATGSAITLSTTAQNGEQTLQFFPNSPTDSGAVWITVIATLTGSGVSPTMAYRADLLMSSAAP